MSFIKHEIGSLVGGDGTSPDQGIRIHHLDITKKLSEAFGGFNCDIAGRLGLWTPRQRELVGLYHFHKHVSSMDRGWATQWPQWTTKAGLVEVSLDYALAHDDLPIVNLTSDGQAILKDQTVATVIRPKLKSVKRVGWAEVFYYLLKLNIHGLDTHWLSRTFRVPMDWYGNAERPPLDQSYFIAKKKGYA